MLPFLLLSSSNLIDLDAHGLSNPAIPKTSTEQKYSTTEKNCNILAYAFTSTEFNFQ